MLNELDKIGGKTMIQQCPVCGQWCEVEKKGFLDKASRGFNNAAEGVGSIGASIGRRLFGKTGEKYGAIIGGGVAGGSGLGYLNAATESLFGDAYHFVCPTCGHEWGTDDPEDDQTEEYYQMLAEQEAEQERNEMIIELRDKYSSVIHASKQEQQEYIKELQYQLSNDNNTNGQIATLYDTIAASYQLIGDRNNALKAVNSSLALFEDDENTRILKGIIMGQGRNAQDTYAAMQEVINYKSDDRPESPFISTSQIEDEFSKLQTSFSQNFLSLPLHQRKHLVICDELIYLPNSFRVLPMAEIPTNLKFPVGHPVSNTLYVCHPYRTDYYIPYDTYEVEILRDEIEEFKKIMEHLGARHIDLSDMFENNKEMSQQKRRDIHGGGNYEGQYGAHGVYDAEDNSVITIKLRSVIEGNSDYLLAGKPTLPKDLVWYDHRVEWQNKCESRLAGRLVHDYFTISVSSSEMTTEFERKKIEADMNILLVSAEGGAESSNSYTMKREKERIWKINVEFYPLSDYDKKEAIETTPLITNALPVTESVSPKKKNNLMWMMGAIIFILITIIMGMLFI